MNVESNWKFTPEFINDVLQHGSAAPKACKLCVTGENIQAKITDSKGETLANLSIDDVVARSMFGNNCSYFLEFESEMRSEAIENGVAYTVISVIPLPEKK